ncbi:diguanylate cyclase domain-containing protein [Marinicrinis lubricantis]|uniref:Diguanylate cyclase domain-containing protein n=1 Tax=Marinicrinis lubricantis TaxID=2086470 RepID=A0ABW1IM51_9BACL
MGVSLKNEMIVTSLLNSMLEPAMVVDQDGHKAAVNRAWIEAFQRNEFPWKASGDKGGAFDDQLNAVLLGKQCVYEEEWVWTIQEERYRIRMSPIHHHEGFIMGALIQCTNISQQKEMEQAYQIAEERLSKITENSFEIIKITDFHGNVAYSSPSHQKILGYEHEETSIFEAIHPEDKQHIEEVYRKVRETGESCMIEVRKKHRNGRWVWLAASFNPIVHSNDTSTHILVISRDISERKKIEQELQYMAYHDALTGLYNRRRFTELMESSCAEAAANQAKVALIMMDLDKFKSINDTYGHAAGDELLKQFAKRLLECRRDGDVVGRISGDEFAVLLKVQSQEEVKTFIQAFYEVLEDTEIVLNEHTLKVKSSAGYAMYPDHGNNLSKLFKHADMELYKEKRRRHAKHWIAKGSRLRESSRRWRDLMCK